MKQKMIESLKGLKDVECWDFYFVTHPSNLAVLRTELDEINARGARGYGPWHFARYDSIEIRTNEYMPKFVQRWEPPNWGNFVQFDASDEEWLIPLKMGRWVDTSDILIYKINNQAMRTFSPYNYLPMNPRNYILTATS